MSPLRPRTLARPLIMAAAVAAVPLAAFAAGEAKMQTAVFAGGCFWTLEKGLEHVPGVLKAESGYTGGKTARPSYEDVNTETTGHLEAVRVTFDPAKISYRQLTDRYWRMIDPTQADGQACDRAPSYHSAVFVSSPEQRRAAEASRAAIDTGAMKGKIATQIRDAAAFWPAEGHHQDYAEKNPAAYARYAQGCGRDRQLRVVWGGR